MEYFLNLLYIYLGIGIGYGLFTFRSTVDFLYEKYPTMDAVGYNKLRKFMYVFFKINALGFGVIIHVAIMSLLWALDVFTKGKVKKHG